MKIVEEFLLREVAGEYMLIPVGETAQKFNGLITLSETAKFIWNHVEQVNSLDELVQRITEKYDVDKETARRDAYLFVSGMLERGFAVTTKEDHTW